MGIAKFNEMVQVCYRMQNGDFMKRVYESQIRGQGVAGRPPIKWINRTEEYLKRGERVCVNDVKRECINRENWRLSAMATPSKEIPGGNVASEL